MVLKTRQRFGIVCALLLMSLSSGSAAPSVTTNKTSYSPGERVTINGSGFQPSVWFSIEAHDPGEAIVGLNQSKSDAAGAFTTYFNLRSDAKAGEYTVYASNGTVYTCKFSVVLPPSPPPPPPPPSTTYVSTKLNLSLSGKETRLGVGVLAYGYISPALSSSILIQSSSDGMNWENLATVVSNKSGYYSYLAYPLRTGSFHLRAIFGGIGNYLASSSASEALTVLNLDSMVVLSPERQVIKLGENATLRADLVPRTPTDVEFETSTDGKRWAIFAVVRTGQQGQAVLKWRPTLAGVSFFRAKWFGNDAYTGCESSTCTLEVTVPVAIKIAGSPLNATAGGRVTITGSVSPAQVGSVQIDISEDGGITWRELSQTKVEASGLISYAHDFESAGTFLLRVSYQEFSSNAIRVIVKKTSTSLEVSTSTPELTVGSAAAIVGFIRPVIADAVIEVTFVSPTGIRKIRKAATDAKGEFALDFTPDSVGKWSVSASWKGNEGYDGSSARLTSLEVKALPFDPFIATTVVLIVAVKVLVIYTLLKRRQRYPAVPRAA